ARDRRVLHVDILALALDDVDDAADDVVDGPVLRHLGEPRGRTRGNEHDLADAGPDRIDRDDRVPGRLEAAVDLTPEQQLAPREPGVLAGAHHGAQHLGENHRYFCLPPTASRWRIGSASSSWPCGRGMTCTDTTSPTFAAAAAPASVAARTAA